MPLSAHRSTRIEACAPLHSAQSSPAPHELRHATGRLPTPLHHPLRALPGNTGGADDQLNEDGSANISPLSSFWALGDRVVLGIGEQGQGCSNLLARGEC